MKTSEELREIRSLGDMLAPISEEEFLTEFFGKRPVYISGEARRDRFRGIISLGALNGVLTSASGAPNFRIFREGKAVPQQSFTKEQTSWVAGKAALMDAGAVATQLASGASIIVNRVEHLSSSVSRVARILEQVFRNYVDVVAFCSWQSIQGFNTHWDREDVLICQVAGRKKWRLFPNIREYPTAQDRVSPGDPPSGEPHWEGILEEGDVLYIPNGWWHDATALDGASLHLSFGTELPTGFDLAQIVIRKLSETAAFRAPVPAFLSDNSRQEYMCRFRQMLKEELDRTDLDAVLTARDEGAPMRGHLSFPWSATPDLERFPIPSSASVHWLPSRPARFCERDGELKLEANGSTFGFAPAAEPVLSDLTSHRSTSLQALVSRHEDIEPRAIEEFLMELVKTGLIAIAED